MARHNYTFCFTQESQDDSYFTLSNKLKTESIFQLWFTKKENGDGIELCFIWEVEVM